MPTPRTLARTIVDVEALLASMELNANELPSYEEEKAELVTLLAELKRLVTRRDNFRVEKLVVSQQLDVSKARALDAMSNLRSQLKGKLGGRNKKLNEFGVAPNRGAGGRKKKVPAAPAPAGFQTVQAVQATTVLPGTPVALVVAPSPAAIPTQT